MTQTANTTNSADVVTKVMDMEHEILEVGYLAQLAADLGTTDTLHKESVVALSGPLLEYADDLRTKWRKAHTAAVEARQQTADAAPAPAGANDRRLQALATQVRARLAEQYQAAQDDDTDAVEDANERLATALGLVRDTPADGAAGIRAKAAVVKALQQDYATYTPNRARAWDQVFCDTRIPELAGQVIEAMAGDGV